MGAAVGGTAEAGLGTTGELGTPDTTGGAEGTPPRGFSGARGVRGLGGPPAGEATGAEDGMEGTEGLAGAEPAGTGGFSGAEGTDPVAGSGAPVVGTGLGGSFNGGSFTGEGEPAGKSEAGGVFGDGVSLTVVVNCVRRFMCRICSCQSCSKETEHNPSRRRSTQARKSLPASPLGLFWRLEGFECLMSNPE